MEKTLSEHLKILLPSSVSICGDPSADLIKCIELFLSAVGDESLSNSLSQLEIHEAFSMCCVYFLKRCCTELIKRDVGEVPHFSVYQEGQLKICFEFLLCLGVYPLMDAGTLLPLELRMEHYRAFQCPHTCNQLDRDEKLVRIAECLLQLHSCGIDQLERLVNSPALFLGDLIAVLMQLAYGSQQQSGPVDSRNWRHRFWRFLCRLPGHLAMRELIVLQGGIRSPTKQIKGAVRLPVAPVWLRRACGCLLSRLLLRLSLSPRSPPTGVMQLIMAAASLAPGLADPLGNCIASLDPRLQPALAISLAEILSATPAACSSSAKTANPPDKPSGGQCVAYYQSIAKQIIEILQRPHTTVGGAPVKASNDSVERFASLVSLHAVHALSKKYPDVGRQFLIWPLIESLRRCVIDDEDQPANLDTCNSDMPFDKTELCTLASCSQLGSSVDQYITLLSCQSPSRQVLRDLVAYSRPLFHLLIEVTAATRVARSQKDSADMSEAELDALGSLAVDPDVTALRNQLLISLSRLVLSFSDSRACRVRLIRNWLELPQLPESFPVTDADPGSSLSVYPCHRGLVFKPRHLITVTDPKENLNADSHEFPYRAVLIRQSLPPLSQSDLLPTANLAVIDLLKITNGDSLSMIEESYQLKEHSGLDEDVSPVSLFSSNARGDISTPSVGKTLIADLFISLVADLNVSIVRHINLACKDIQLPHELRVPDISESDDAQQGTVSSLLAAAMLDCLGSHVWPHEPQQAVSLFKLSIDRFHWILQNVSNNREMEEFVMEMLAQLLGILAFYIQQLGSPGSNSISSSVRDEFQQLLPSLKRLRQLLPTNVDHSASSRNAQLQLLDCLIVALATRGAVTSLGSGDHLTWTANASSTTDKTVDAHSIPPVPLTASSQVTRPLIEEIQTPYEVNSSESMSNHLPNTTTDQPMCTRLSDILAALDDPFVPVRGHALIELSRLLEARDTCLCGFENRIFECLLHHLADEDSYIYLSAIRALAGLGCSLTDRVLDVLLRQFSQQPPNAASTTKRQVEFRLTLSEAVMRILRQLGAMAPKYRDTVLQTMVSVARHDPEPLIRAAGLSNITELCMLLSHSIQPVVYELLALVEWHLTSDPATTVRCAAANLARGLLNPPSSSSASAGLMCAGVSGSGRELILPADVLRDLNRLLSTRLAVDKDEDVREQLEAALGALHRRTCNSLFPDENTKASSLVKAIQILRPFDT